MPHAIEADHAHAAALGAPLEVGVGGRSCLLRRLRRHEDGATAAGRVRVTVQLLAVMANRQSRRAQQLPLRPTLLPLLLPALNLNLFGRHPRPRYSLDLTGLPLVVMLVGVF